MEPNKPKRSMNIPIKWSVHPHRQDKRTGALSPVKISPYGKYLKDEIENMFKKEK